MKKILLSVFALITLASCQKDADMEVINKGNKAPNKNAVVNKDATFIDGEEAAEIGKKFAVAQGLFGPATKSMTIDTNMTYTDLGDGPVTKSSTKKPAFYVYDLNGKGYVIVSAHRAANPVLGYSMNGKFNSKQMSKGLVGVLNSFSDDIKLARKNKVMPNAKTAVARAEMLTPGALTKGDMSSVRPILGNIQWNQSPHYNALCPPRTPVGCVATAALQIMRHWKYPKTSTGTHRYSVRTMRNTVLSFDYNRSWDWDSMPESPLRRPNREVAAISYAVAVSVDMRFGTGGSGAMTNEVPAAMKKYFKYPNTIRYANRRDYSGNSWSKLIHGELAAGRPVEYCGHGSGGGHAFVCDGYKGNGYFHFNWGWAGSSDGYFLLNALNPGSLGVGGGSGGFNRGQGAVIGFAPPAGGGGRVDPVNPRPNPVNPRPNPVNPGGSKDYCRSKGQNSKYVFIGGFGFDNDVRTSRSGSYNGYTDSTRSPFSITRGRQAAITFTPGFYYYKYNVSWKMWIDLNKDGKFSNDEAVHSSTGSNAVRAGLTLPRSVRAGKYNVRVSAKYGGYASPCETFNYGEVKDFTLNVR